MSVKIDETFTGSETVNIILSKYGNENIKNHIIFLSWIKENEKVKLYNSVDILLLPSYNEGLPYVILEAMAARLPIIASTVGGIPEIIEDGYNGFLVDPNDPILLARRIEELITDEHLRSEFVRNGLKTVRTKFSAKVQLNNLFQSLKSSSKK